MEWWSNGRKNPLGHGCAGFTEDGQTFLTFDIRRNGEGILPVFSPMCKIGHREGMNNPLYVTFRNLFVQLPAYSIKELTECEYWILHNPKVLKFDKNGQQKI